MKAFVDSVTLNLPATDSRLKEYQQAQLDDPICSQVRKHCESSWPAKRPVNEDLIPYWRAKASLSICNDLLLYNDHIVVPSALQEVTLQQLHEGHQGIQRCKLRATRSVWWPNISKQIDQMIHHCRTCAKDVHHYK